MSIAASSRPSTAAGYRAIVMDHLGFGRSDKPDDARRYTIPKHADRCEALLEALDLHGAIVVVQDWGGPIGLTWAARHPERVAGLFILNTFFQRPLAKVPPAADPQGLSHAGCRRGAGQGSARLCPRFPV